MMRIIIAAIFTSIVFSSCSQTYFIVRHAEKATAEANMSSDVSLTDKGKERAEALKEVLRKEKISYIYSTNTIRTKSTAEPTAAYFNLPVETYGPRPDSAFISLLKTKKKNVLVVGHSNTIDDVVNKLCGETKVPGDLPETEYDNLFVIKKKGHKMIFQQKKYGKP